jgi:hypothetical protein
MKIAIMQPYLFPYIGYFQLIYAVDKFVFLDDVNFIKRGWINRNRILVNGIEHLFSVPVKKISQNKLILECELAESWKEDFLKTIEMSYKKAPYFTFAYPLILDIINFKEQNLSLYIVNHIKRIFEYLDIKIHVIPSSSIYRTSELKAQDKIIQICKEENASEYINPIGGTELYDKNKFSEENITLKFLKTSEIIYKQFRHTFVPFLSIIDILMFNSKEEIKIMLDKYTLV